MHIQVNIFNSAWCEVIWRYSTWLTLVQAMACCLMAPSYYQKQYWPKINEIFWRSFQENIHLNTKYIDPRIEFQIYAYGIPVIFLRGNELMNYMMTSSNGNIFRVTGHLCGNSLVPGEFPTQRPVTRSFDVFFVLRLNKRLSKQSWGWLFETLSRPLWRHRNEEWGCSIGYGKRTQRTSADLYTI